jgi:hypothetical protein
MQTTYTFRIEARGIGSADVVRNDGKVVRTSLWPDAAAIECELLTAFAAGRMTTAEYFAARGHRFAACRA